MNIYDTANKLAKEIRESDEYVTFKKLKEEIAADLEKKNKLDEFEKARYEAQILSIQGVEGNTEKLIKLQEQYTELLKDESIQAYFEAEIRFSTILQDVNRIIAEAVKDIIGIGIEE